MKIQDLQEKYNEIPKGEGESIPLHEISSDIALVIHKEIISEFPVIEFEEMNSNFKVRKSTKNLQHIEIFTEQDKLILRLSNTEYIDVFFIFIQDLANSIKNQKKGEVLEGIFIKTEIWSELLGSFIKQTSDSKIQGLFGELKFIENFSKHFGLKKMINSWQGNKALHDFEIDSNSFEVKTSTTEIITISNDRQLKISKSNLYLYYLKLKKITGNSKAENASNLVKKIEENIDGSILADFRTKLGEIGYNSDEFERLGFEIIDERLYTVNNKFPKITINELNSSITEVRYKINLSELGEFKTNLEKIII